MGAIGPGDWAEYIGGGKSNGLIRQCVAVTAPVGVCHKCGFRGAGLIFANLKAKRNDQDAFCPCHWRLIYRPKSELLESLLKKADESIREDA